MRTAIFVYIFIMTSGCFSKVPEKTGLEGNPLPSFNLFLADSSTYFNTSSIPSGKPISLFYFGPYCPYSRAQMEEIINNMRSLNNVQFYIFTTSPFKDLKRFYQYYHLDKYPNIISGVDYTNFFNNYFWIPGVPYMAIYGKDKRLKGAFIGKVDSRQIKSLANE